MASEDLEYSPWDLFIYEAWQSWLLFIFIVWKRAAWTFIILCSTKERLKGRVNGDFLNLLNY